MQRQAREHRGKKTRARESATSHVFVVRALLFTGFSGVLFEEKKCAFPGDFTPENISQTPLSPTISSRGVC